MKNAASPLGFIWPIFLPNSYLNYCRDYLCNQNREPADEAVLRLQKFIVVTAQIYRKKIVRVLGLVRGNTIRARHVGKDIVAGLRNVVGGEVTGMKLLSESREQALDRMLVEAESLGANAVISVRFETSVIWVVRPK